MTVIAQTSHSPRQAAAAAAQASAPTATGRSSFATLLAATGGAISGNESTAAAANSAAPPAASAAPPVESTPAPAIPEGQRWYMRPTGRTANGAQIYDTPLGEIGRSPRYGNWFIRYGDDAAAGAGVAANDETPHMIALATSNFRPSYQEIWSMFQQAGITPTWQADTRQVPGALPTAEHAGFSDPQRALNKITEWHHSGAMWEEGFQLPALNMAELPEGSDHPLLRELSQELRRVVADAPADQQSDMVALLQEQGYGEFLPGGRWFTPAEGNGATDPLAAEAALAVADPWNPGVRWQDDPSDWRNQVAPADWADNQIPGPAQWGTRFVNPTAAAGWIDRALETGAFWTGLNLPRYAPVSDPAVQPLVDAAMDWDLGAGEKRLRDSIQRAIDAAPEVRREDLKAVFARQGFARFLESEPAAAAAVAPAAAAAPPVGAAAAPPAQSAASSAAAATSSSTAAAAAAAPASAPAATAEAAPATVGPYQHLFDAIRQLRAASPELDANFQQAASLLAALAAQSEQLQSAFARSDTALASYSALGQAGGEASRSVST